MSPGETRCPDQCGVRPERWETYRARSGQAMRCRVCKRFIGYVKKEPSHGKRNGD